MANSNFVVQNGLTVGTTTIFAGNGDVVTSGNISVTGGGSFGGLSSNQIYQSTSNVNVANGSVTIGIGSAGNVATFSSTGLTVSNITVTGTETVNNTEYVTTLNATTLQAATMGNIGANVIGTGTYLTSLTGPNVIGTVTTANVSLYDSYSTSSTNATFYPQLADKTTGNGAAYTTSTLTHNPSTGVLSATSFAGTGNFTTAVATNLSSGNLTVTGTISASTNGTINIGAAGTTFANVYATNFIGISSTAKYADLAENYQADSNYTYGTVVMFGGAAEVTLAEADTTRVAGVVSQNPAHLMNGGLTGANIVPLALQGRVPCNVIGPVKKGDLMTSAGFGYAKSNNSAAVGQVIGKALSDFTGAKGQIEVVVGRV